MIRFRQFENSLSGQRINEVLAESDINETSEVKKVAKKSSPISIENVGWIVGAVVICYYTDFFNTLLYDERVDRSWLHATILCGSVLLFVASYLIVYLYMIKHIDPDDWDELYPSAIPCATASAVLFGICLMVAIWPVWGILGLPMLFVMFMAFVCFVCMLDVFTFLCSKKNASSQE